MEFIDEQHLICCIRHCSVEYDEANSAYEVHASMEWRGGGGGGGEAVSHPQSHRDAWVLGLLDSCKIEVQAAQHR